MSTSPANHWLRLGRVILFAYALFMIGLALVGIALFPSYARLHAAEFTPNLSWTPALTQAALAQLGWPATSMAYVDLVRNLLMFISGSAVALLLLWGRPASWFIFYLAFVLISFGAGEAFFKPVMVVFPGISAFGDFLGASTWQFFFILFYFFPNGKPVPVWTRWLALSWFGFIGILPIIGDDLPADPVWSNFFIVVVLSALVSQAYRYFWRSDPVQRQQVKWIAVVVGLLIVYMPVSILFGLSEPSGSDLRFSLITSIANLLFFNFLIALFPLAVAVAVFRYRLWDIDLIIRRTLQYGVLSLLLGLMYSGMVVLLGQFFLAFSGQESPLVVVISTLAIAALFTPLRRRVQTVIDRRFYRSRYNAEQVLQRFFEWTRSQADLAELSGHLITTVYGAVEPHSIGLWLRAPKSQAKTDEHQLEPKK